MLLPVASSGWLGWWAMDWETFQSEAWTADCLQCRWLWTQVERIHFKKKPTSPAAFFLLCVDTKRVPELVDDGDLLLRDIPPALGEPRPCTDGRRPYDADFDTLHSAETKELQMFIIDIIICSSALEISATSHPKRRPSPYLQVRPQKPVWDPPVQPHGPLPPFMPFIACWVQLLFIE